MASPETPCLVESGAEVVSENNASVVQCDVDNDNDCSSVNDNENDIVYNSGMNSPVETENVSRIDWLEKSWRGLENFNHSHIGRICGDEMETLMELVRKLSIVREEPEDLYDLTGIDFIIPELPTGTKLRFEIKSTWGDPHYVGLNGIEIFGSNGDIASIESITADPCDLRSLPEFANDPRVVSNLIDGIYKTRDDTHLWLTTFTSNKDHFIYITLSQPTVIAMIRIWNYNKSRIHSFRGVRHMQIYLDDLPIFKGEIAKAPGVQDTNTENLSDTILFTMDDDILQNISMNDKSFSCSTSLENSFSQQDNSTTTQKESYRPATGDRSGKKVLKKLPATEETPCLLKNMLSMEGDNVVVKARSTVLNGFTLQITQNWGSPEFLGLTGFQIINREGGPYVIYPKMLSCSLASVTLDRLVNERNVTVDDVDMWITRWDGVNPLSIHVRFPEKVAALGFKIWNFNKSLEMSYAGAKFVNMFADDELVLSNVLLRKAPGNLHYNFEQDVYFGFGGEIGTQPTVSTPPTGYELKGFVYQLQLLSTWGDEFYMGLNGIEMYDIKEQPIKLTMKNIAAYPESVNVLPDVQYDVRSSDKLIDGVNDTKDVYHMWLTPVIPSVLNRIYIIFDVPTAISRLHVWNYSKTPKRGVLVDDTIVYTGEIECSTEDRVGSTKLNFSEFLT